jgi:lysyl-tRNA synthetase class II
VYLLECADELGVEMVLAVVGPSRANWRQNLRDWLCYNVADMATLKDFRDERLRKLKTLQDMGINPYTAESHRTHNASDIVTQFDNLQGQVVTAVGRIVGIRKFGKLAFIALR